MLKPNPSFVLLHHVLSDKVHFLSDTEHWDLCLDRGETLATWQVLRDPRTTPDKTTHSWPARRLADHRRVYLEYEGPISGDRGNVRRVDQGTWEALEQGPINWVVRLDGTALKGVYRLPAGAEPGEMFQIGMDELPEDPGFRTG
jgi:hypothetical protein